MNRIIWVAGVDSAIVVVLIFLVQNHTVRAYPAAVLVMGAAFLLNFFLLRTKFASLPAHNRGKLEVFGRHGTNRLIWLFSVGIVIAVVIAVAFRDSRHLIQAMIGLFLVGYMLFALRALNRARKKK